MTTSVHATYLVSAPDQAGLVAQISGFFYHRGINIVDASNHTDPYSEGGPRFFMRLVANLGTLGATDPPSSAGGLERPASRLAMEEAMSTLVQKLKGTWSVSYDDERPRVAILVTTESACLFDLVLRQREGELKCDIPLVVGNRTTLESTAQLFRIPFYCLPVTPETKPKQEKQLLDLLKRHHIDLVVLARYMQILSADFLEKSPPVINIHHGFLPAFQGAKPYHQAHARGVKMIGATAHYATKDLDQGPIIEQDVIRVNHELGPEEMARVGRDVERLVLSRAVRAHLERRILVEGRRTIVL